MEATYYYIIISALLIDYLLSTVSGILNMNSITEDVPIEFQEYYDKDKYAKSQSYLREKTRFGIFSGTFSLVITLVVIHTGAFGLLDNIVRSYSDHFIVNGLMFFGILFIINDIINIPFSIYGTFVIEERYDFNKTIGKRLYQIS